MDIVRFLVENEININARDRQGRSALNIALERGEMNIHSYLIANGAMEFETTQVTQSATPAPAQSTTVIVQQPAQSPTPVQTQQSTQTTPAVPRLSSGVFSDRSVSGSQINLVLNTNRTGGTATHQINRANTSAGNVTISGDQLTITWNSGPLSGMRTVYRIDSSNQFSNAHEVWRMGI
jgi:ankyrin repeat protein